jgi:CopG family nickel-responsive transcriptional regulator
MQRITVTVDDDLNKEFQAFMARRGYSNRSEAFRDLLRERIERDRFAEASAPTCVGCLTYVYGYAERQLPRRLVEAQHARHDLTVSTLHLHLDHENCMEAVILRGRTEEVTAFATGVTAQRSVRHGHLWLVPVVLEADAHPGQGHGGGGLHVHSRPTS